MYWVAIGRKRGEMHRSMKRPNIIWVFGDQHRRQQLSVAGDPNLQTPNIDQLAEYGIRFQRAYANCPLCCPARGTLLTSRHAHAMIPGHNFGLPPDTRTVAHAFGEAGYRTAWFGKWHVGGKCKLDGEGNLQWQPMPQHRSAPPDQPRRETFDWMARDRRGGFEYWLGYENNNAPHHTWVHGHDESGQEIDLHRLPGFETDSLTDLLLDYLERRAQEHAQPGGAPFFAALSVQPPHDPYSAPEGFMGRHNPARMRLPANVPAVPWVEERARREYAGACALVENLDWNLGRIRQALRRTGLDQNTIILFFSDHGDMHGSHGLFHKTNPYEEAAGIPLIIGGGLDVGGASSIRMITQAPASLIDLAPTSLGLCGISPPPWMEGVDLSGFRRPNRQTHPPAPDSVFLQLVRPTGHPDSIDRAWRGIVTSDGWKYVCFENTDWLMFNLESDPLELANLAHNTRFKEKRADLRQRLRAWVERTGDCFHVPI